MLRAKDPHVFYESLKALVETLPSAHVREWGRLVLNQMLITWDSGISLVSGMRRI
jgi:hypothetical protein